jgi:NS3 polyprotein peptidase S31
MRTRILRAVVAAAVSALVAASLAGTAVAASAGKATGGGSVAADLSNPFAPYNISFNAQAVSDDTNPFAAKGHVHFKNEGGHFSGDVTCYAQSGDTAFFSGEILKGTGGLDPAQGVTGRAFYTVSVQDNGEGGSQPDLISFIAAVDVPLNCFDAGAPTSELATGNIQVQE